MKCKLASSWVCAHLLPQVRRASARLEHRWLPNEIWAEICCCLESLDSSRNGTQHLNLTTSHLNAFLRLLYAKKRQNFPATFFTNVSRTKITEFRLYTWFPSSNNTATERSDHAAALQDARYVIKSVICDPNFERLVLGCIEADFCK